MRRAIALIATLSLSSSLLAASTPNRAVVPKTGVAPVVDGRVNAAEWKGATHLALSENAGEALLLHDGNYLYVGIVGLQPGIGSLCAQGRGGIRVLHASAALGTAAFELKDGKWVMSRGFNWSNRDTGTSAEAMAERENTLETAGWFANTSRTAMTTREYQIPIRGQKEIPLTIGFYIYTPEEQKLSYWPASLEDDCADRELASGFTDRTFTFDPSKWGVVELKQ